ncbi:HD domain-containing phosphohydrolase [Ferrimonas sp. SCSIO 43195]|uniref:HD domain-containing phosphohydrolase n=1 Tax=Ferrimonas sp. SCSIO 43195 TaxID=2822844 RepID=UPI00207637C0|nr:HD domain-containing phosphohydrolase [Ferrimonas sp. SCSIO 43195]USD36135.1 HD domain-containing protein [Ferrimonas sp. SCSIO 43195]
MNHGLNPAALPEDLLRQSRLMWARLEPDLTVSQASESFMDAVQGPATLPAPLTELMPAITAQQLQQLGDLGSHTSLNLIDRHGKGLQCDLHPSDDGHGWLTLIRFNLDNRWLMQLHPDYNHALQSSDQWLGHLESVMQSAPEQVFQQAILNAVHLSGSEHGYLMQLSDNRDSLTLTATTLDDAPLQHSFATPQLPVQQQCLLQQQPVIDNAPDSATVAPWLNGLGIRNHLCLPVNYRGRTVGIVGVVNRASAYTDIDAKTLLVYSTIIWHAIQLPRTLKVVARQSQLIRKQKLQLNQSLVKLVSAISDSLELNDPYTAGHQRAVAELAYQIGEKMGMSQHQLEGLKLGALIHDIGKLAIPSQLLSKPSRLSSQEFELIKTHAVKGADIIKDVVFPWPIKAMILQHHERLDGSGYPMGLKGEAIILEARILAVADVADSMLSHRPYRPAQGFENLRQVLMEGRGSLFDATAVDLCLSILCKQQSSNHNLVNALPLNNVVILHLDDTLEQAEQRLHSQDASVGFVVDDHSPRLLGYLTASMLTFWHSPLLDTAAERTLDRELQQRKLHQVMRHNIPSIPCCTSLANAALALQQSDEHFLLVTDNDEQPQGVLTWPTLATALQHQHPADNHPWTGVNLGFSDSTAN